MSHALDPWLPGSDVDVDTIFDTNRAMQFLREFPGIFPPELFQAHETIRPSSRATGHSTAPSAPDRPPAAGGRENILNAGSQSEPSSSLHQPRPWASHSTAASIESHSDRNFPFPVSRPAFTYGLRPHNGQDVSRNILSNSAGSSHPLSTSSSSANLRSTVSEPEALIPPTSSQLSEQQQHPPRPASQNAKTKRTTVAETKSTLAPRKAKLATDSVSNSSISTVTTRRSTRAVGAAAKVGTVSSSAEPATGPGLRKRLTKAVSSAPPTTKDHVETDVKMEDVHAVGTTNGTDALNWTEIEAAVESLFLTLRILGAGVNHLCQYRCREALDTFSCAPPEHYNTGWTLCQAAKAQFEIAEYRRAEQLFLQARELEPYRMEDMEVFSVALWHMHKEVELSYLAHDLVETDKRRPQAWCAVGNSFSLKQEHDIALKCFQRAIQLDSQFAYAYTLAGHEYIANEDLDKAQSCFRHALRIDERHYNAWYGLGYLFYRQEKLQMAKFHFESALAINKESPILTYYIGMVGHGAVVEADFGSFGGHCQVLQNTDHKEEALQKYEEALRMAPRNPLFKFAKAEVLFALERYDEALEDLQNLAGYTQEPNVYFLMGKVYKAQGDNRNALLAFTKADTRSSKSSMVKDQIERLQTDDGEDMSP